MFTSVLFDDINKAAFDVMKDGYSFDQKATLKTSLRGCNMTVEGKNLTSACSGKVSIDFKPFTYLSVKKLSLENSGAAVCDVDVPNFLYGTTFMFRSQGDVFTQDVKKASCGLKFMSSGFASEVTYDTISEKFSTSAVAARGNLMFGCKVQGTKEGVSAVEAAAAYRFKECVFSLATLSNHTALDFAVYAKPYKNVQFGADCVLALKEAKNPAIAFGMCTKPTKSSEMRTKIAMDGKIYGFYKTAMSKNVTVSVSGAVDYNNMMNGTHKVGVAVEMRI